MSIERYRYDELAESVPYDFALAWAEAATPEVQSLLQVRQSGRWYYWRASAEDRHRLPSASTLNRSMANTHIVAGTEEAAKEISRVRAGDTIFAEGYLVDLVGTDAETSRGSSLSRNDSGAGACEIFYVMALRIER